MVGVKYRNLCNLDVHIKSQLFFYDVVKSLKDTSVQCSLLLFWTAHSLRF